MSAKGFLREKIAELFYDELEPYKIMDGVLLSVFADEDSEWLNLNFSSGGLFLRAQGSDDTITLRDGCRNFDGLDISGNITWKDLIGREYGWGWLAINNQGYIDTALIGFGPIPEIAVTVAASALKVSRIGDWRQVSQQ